MMTTFHDMITIMLWAHCFPAHYQNGFPVHVFWSCLWFMFKWFIHVYDSCLWFMFFFRNPPPWSAKTPWLRKRMRAPEALCWLTCGKDIRAMCLRVIFFFWWSAERNQSCHWFGVLKFHKSMHPCMYIYKYILILSCPWTMSCSYFWHDTFWTSCRKFWFGHAMFVSRDVHAMRLPWIHLSLMAPTSQMIMESGWWTAEVNEQLVSDWSKHSTMRFKSPGHPEKIREVGGSRISAVGCSCLTVHYVSFERLVPCSRHMQLTKQHFFDPNPVLGLKRLSLVKNYSGFPCKHHYMLKWHIMILVQNI